ncbi:osmotic avoidance abnormal protein 3-like isoform X2 [Tachypleus tridentatus]
MYAFRLHELQEQMVGGEKASDKRLKEERVRKRNYAEKKIKCVRETLSNLDDDDGVMMKVYDDIHDELKAKTVLVKKAKKKIQALEREISDLHSEFEDDRTDYLETIRKQDQQIKLLQQILEKVQPCIRRDCNYSNIDKIKLDSSWDEDLQKWHIPELVIEKNRLPPPGIQPGCNLPLASARSAPTPMDSGYLQESSDEKFRQKLEQGEREDIAGSYFKPRRQEQLLNKFQREANRVF